MGDRISWTATGRALVHPDELRGEFGVKVTLMQMLVREALRHGGSTPASQRAWLLNLCTGAMEGLPMPVENPVLREVA